MLLCLCTRAGVSPTYTNVPLAEELQATSFDYVAREAVKEFFYYDKISKLGLWWCLSEIDDGKF